MESFLCQSHVLPGNPGQPDQEWMEADVNDVHRGRQAGFTDLVDNSTTTPDIQDIQAHPQYHSNNN